MKEKVFKSTRTKALLIAALFYVFAYVADYLNATFGFEISAEQVTQLADKVSLLIAAWVASRTVRNTDGVIPG